MFSSTTVRAGKSTPAATVAVAKIASRSPALIKCSMASVQAGMCPAWCEGAAPRSTMFPRREAAVGVEERCAKRDGARAGAGDDANVYASHFGNPVGELFGAPDRCGEQ